MTTFFLCFFAGYFTAIPCGPTSAMLSLQVSERYVYSALWLIFGVCVGDSMLMYAALFYREEFLAFPFKDFRVLIALGLVCCSIYFWGVKDVQKTICRTWYKSFAFGFVTTITLLGNLLYFANVFDWATSHSGKDSISTIFMIVLLGITLGWGTFLFLCCKKQNFLQQWSQCIKKAIAVICFACAFYVAFLWH